MKKLLYILRSMAMVAGTERVVTDKINWLAEHGYEVTLVTYEQGDHPLAFPLHASVKVYDLDVRFFKLQVYPLIRRFHEYQKLRSLFRQRLKSVVDSFNPDIVITTAYSLKVADDIIRICKNARSIIESHETCFSVVKAYDYQSNPFMRMIAKVYDRKYYQSINRFDRLITLTEGDANEWRKHVSSVIGVIPNPLTYYPLELAERSVDGSFRIISAGRLEEVKGFDMLIEAFALIADKCPQWYVDIFGKGSCEKALEQMIISKRLVGRVKIHQPTTSIYDEYAKSGLYVLSSRHEGMGMSILEAMSCGIPCVAFDCEYGPAEIICHKETGLLVENRNVSKLADAMLWAIEHPNDRLQMGLAARESVKKYRKEMIMQRWVELFNRLN